MVERVHLSISSLCPLTDRPWGEPLSFLFGLLPRKEVIQPHLPIRLPCYDFTPVIGLALGGWLLAVTSPTLGTPNSHGVTGGVYKARERIHRGYADPRLLASPRLHVGRVVAPQSELGSLFDHCSPSTGSLLFVVAIVALCSPGHKGHDDLTSSPPSSELSRQFIGESSALPVSN